MTRATIQNMEEITIRKASIDDMETLLRFEQGVINAERPFDPTLKKEDARYYDLEGLMSAPHVELLVAESGSKIIGSGYARIESSKDYLKHRRHAYLGFIYVEPNYRGKGVSKMIVEALTEWSAGQNVTELRLEVYYDNLSAIKAYEKVGFTRLMIEMRKGLDEVGIE